MGAFLTVELVSPTICGPFAKATKRVISTFKLRLIVGGREDLLVIHYYLEDVGVKLLCEVHALVF
jgi:hypothetical protein